MGSEMCIRDSPLEGEVPFEITLNASGSSDADGEIVSYIYSDGENVISTDSSSMTFTQEIPGTYTYSVEVVDNDGLKDVASVQVVAKPKVTTEESALSAYFKFNMIPKGQANEGNYDLELIYEGRSFNDKVITEAYYTIAGEIRVDVGRRVLGHVDVLPVQFSPTDQAVDMSLTIVDELGGIETFTHSLNPNNPNPLVFVDAIEYAPSESKRRYIEPITQSTITSLGILLAQGEIRRAYIDHNVYGTSTN